VRGRGRQPGKHKTTTEGRWGGKFRISNRKPKEYWGPGESKNYDRPQKKEKKTTTASALINTYQSTKKRSEEAWEKELEVDTESPEYKY